jgi:hypothetical protein
MGINYGIAMLAYRKQAADYGYCCERRCTTTIAVSATTETDYYESDSFLTANHDRFSRVLRAVSPKSTEYDKIV